VRYFFFCGSFFGGGGGGGTYPFLRGSSGGGGGGVYPSRVYPLLSLSLPPDLPDLLEFTTHLT